MLEALAKLKPGAPRRVHLLLAAATWTVVGLGLLAVGVRWCDRGDGFESALLIAGGVATGMLKTWLALRPAATRVVDRIEARGDGRCIGGFFSWRTWLFVAAMSVGGRLLRLTGLPLAVIGFVYVAVGIALLAASSWLWRAWARATAGSSAR